MISLETIQDNISEHKNDIFCPTLEQSNSLNKINTNSWYHAGRIEIKNNIDVKFDDIKPSPSDNLRSCFKVLLLPTPGQRKLLLQWLISYSIMYNETIKFIKKIY